MTPQTLGMPSTNPEDVTRQAHEIAERFRARYGRPATVAALAPGRVNLIGEHTDYNDGFVMPMAIERQAIIVADRAAVGRSARVRVASADAPGVAEFDAAPDLARGEPAWSRYVRGVVALFLRRGIAVPGFDAVVSSTVPMGGGLSSSAALSVSTATLLEALTGVRLPVMEKAELCQRVEHEFAGAPVGIMDVAISSAAEAGHATLLDCRSLERRQVPFADPGIAVVIADTRVKHELSGGEYAARRAECERAAAALGVKSLRDASLEMVQAAGATLGPPERRRARHVIAESARTVRAAAAAEAGDWAGFGRLMFESHASLRDDFEVSAPELDALVELAAELSPAAGVIGSRMTGGGFGGCTVTLARADAVESISCHLREGYRRRTGLDAAVFSTRAAAGARAIAVP